MPPTRDHPPAKVPVKTERTHEENQERAYIAASRRSDRSLEARVESARRASEIHKKRTGRSLRVTEQDVMNEEMYEEEDDDLPAHYRRLTAHLHTGDQRFDQRLTAYLAANVGIRGIIQQHINQSYAQEPSFNNATQLGGNTQYMNMSTMPAQQGSPQMNQGFMQPARTSSSYRQAPYPARPQGQIGMQTTQARRSASFSNSNQNQPSMASPQQSPAGFTNFHQRSASIAVPQTSGPGTGLPSPQIKSEDRKPSISSIPAQSPTVHSSTPTSTGSGGRQRPSFAPGTFSQQQIPQYDNSSNNNNISQINDNFGYLTSALPGNSQGLLGDSLGFDPQFNAALMSGSNDLASNYYSFNNQPLPQTMSVNKSQTYPTTSGLDSTLAPDSLFDNTSAFDNSYVKVAALDNPEFTNDGSGAMTSSANTPGAFDMFDSYTNSEYWDDLSAPQASQ